MEFLNMFKKSANELKSIRCLATTGVLIAVYVTMNSPIFSINTEMLKITFGYLALAAIGMLFGPVVAVIAAVPCDIIAAMIGSLGINPVFTIPKILEGLIYGIFLYGYGLRSANSGGAGWAAWQVGRIVLARFLIMSLVYLVLNSFLIYTIYGVSADSFAAFMAPRVVKNAIQFPIDLALMFLFLPVLGVAYNKINARFGKASS